MNKSDLNKRETPGSLSSSASFASMVIESSSPCPSTLSAKGSSSASLGEVVSVDPFTKARSR